MFATPVGFPQLERTIIYSMARCAVIADEGAAPTTRAKSDTVRSPSFGVQRVLSRSQLGPRATSPRTLLRAMSMGHDVMASAAAHTAPESEHARGKARGLSGAPPV